MLGTVARSINFTNVAGSLGCAHAHVGEGAFATIFSEPCFLIRLYGGADVFARGLHDAHNMNPGSQTIGVNNLHIECGL